MTQGAERRLLLCRAERLEIFDEFEEWNMIQVGVAGYASEHKAYCTVGTRAHTTPVACYAMQDHYCVVIAVNDALGTLQNVGFEHPMDPFPPFPTTTDSRPAT